MPRDHLYRSFPRAVLMLALMANAQPSSGVTPGPSERIDGESLYVGTAPPAAPTHALRLNFAYLPAAGWHAPELVAAARTAAEILGQCRLRVEALALVPLEVDARLRDFHTPASRELAQRMPLERPAVYFVADTRQRPAFDAEAIGRGNSRARPELADSVWITRAARDLGIVVAHELVHVLTDSGRHSEAPRNLMRADTAPQNTMLDAEQCDRVRAVGTAYGLLSEIDRDR